MSNVHDSSVNSAPTIRVWFAVVPELNEPVILTPNIVSLMQDGACSSVSSPNANNTDADVKCSVKTNNQSSISQMATVNK